MAWPHLKQILVNIKQGLFFTRGMWYLDFQKIGLNWKWRWAMYLIFGACV